MIWVKAGGDCTQLFDSYHPLRTQMVLDKYYIGELQREAGDEGKIITYNDDMKKGKFYMDCKLAVEKWFKDRKKDPRVHPEMYAKTFVILAGIAICHYGSFFYTSSFLVSAAFAFFHGVCKAEIGVSIQHDANHGAYGKNKFFLHANYAADAGRRGRILVHVEAAARRGPPRVHQRGGRGPRHPVLAGKRHPPRQRAPAARGVPPVSAQSTSSAPCEQFVASRASRTTSTRTSAARSAGSTSRGSPPARRWRSGAPRRCGRRTT